MERIKKIIIIVMTAILLLYICAGISIAVNKGVKDDLGGPDNPFVDAFDNGDGDTFFNHY